MKVPNSANISLLRVNNGNTRKICKICSKLQLRQKNYVNDIVLLCLLLTFITDFTHCSGVPIVDFEQVIVIKEEAFTTIYKVFQRDPHNMFCIIAK